MAIFNFIHIFDLVNNMKDLIAQKIRLGDEQAFELLFHKFFVRLCGFANKFLNNPEEAREVVLDIYARIWENRDKIDPEDSLKSYMFRIAQNMSLNKLQHRKVESKYVEIYKLVYLENTEYSAHESLLARELDENIKAAINKLPPECKKVFELNRVEGLKYREIAEKLNISVKTVEAQMAKALRKMRLELSDYLTFLIIAAITKNF